MIKLDNKLKADNKNKLLSNYIAPSVKIVMLNICRNPIFRNIPSPPQIQIKPQNNTIYMYDILLLYNIRSIGE